MLITLAKYFLFILAFFEIPRSKLLADEEVMHISSTTNQLLMM
jgi:hypothetical protein